MPTYKITDPTTGKTLRLTGDSPPSETELNQIFGEVHGTPAPKASKPAAAPAEAPKKPGMWQRFKDQVAGDVTEPLRLGSEAVAGVLNLPAKAYKGYKGAGAFAGTLAGGGGLDNALVAGTEAIGDRNPVQSPLAPSRTSQAIGNHLIQPAVNKLSSVTGQPELVNGLVEAGGDIASLLAMKPALNAVSQPLKVAKAAAGNVKKHGLPFSDKANTYRAATTFDNAMQHSPAAASTNALRQGETNALLGRLKPTAPATGPTMGTVPVHPTPGQASGNYQSAALEQSLTAKDPLFAEQLKFNDAQLNKSAVDNLTTKLGSAADLPPIQPAETTGANIRGKIKGAMAPVLSKEAEMWADVPKYPMPAENTSQAFADVLKTPSTAREAVKKVQKIFKATPNTVEGLQTIERELSSAMKAGTDTDRHFLGIIKQAVKADFEAMGESAVSGDVALHEGKIIFPSKLQEELAGLEGKIAAEQEVAAPDIKAMQAQIAKAGPPSMKMTGETAKSFGERIAKEYAKKFPGQPAPTLGTTKALTDMVGRKAAIEKTLAEMTPAEDVAAKYAAAKKYSREEKFQRFYEGAVSRVRAAGDEHGGVNLTNENVPNQFYNPQGAKDLIKAVGKDGAAEQMTPHVIGELISKTVDANSGVMNVPRAMAYVRQNASTLETLGLTDGVMQTIKGQIPRAIEAELESRGVDVMGNPAMTSLQAVKLIKKYGPAVQKLYGAKGIQALTDYGQMMEIMGRNKYVSYAKGSNTIEKASMAGDLADRVSTLGAVVSGHGWIYSASKNILKGMMGPVSKFSRTQVETILKRALMDPEAAKALMEIAKAGKGADVGAIAKKALKPFMTDMAKVTAAGAVKSATTPPSEKPTNPGEELNELGPDETTEMKSWKTIGSDE